MNWIKKHFSSISLGLVMIIGLSLLLYPSLSNYWNSFHQTRAIETYTEAVAELDEADYEKMWAEAQAYNKSLLISSGRWNLSEKETEIYNSLMNVSGNGVIGCIEIPEIKVTLPIYHGVDEGILQVAAGHIPGASLPVGGEGTHCVLSGHRGLPSAKLFTDLDQLAEGDVFILRILNETLTYEVDQIRIVEPSDLSTLEIEPGKDLCTLVTCTPYGINTHRLLVRGQRIENIASDIHVTADAMQIDPLLVAPVVAAPILVILLIVLLTGTHKSNKSEKRRETDRKTNRKNVDKTREKGAER